MSTQKLKPFLYFQLCGTVLIFCGFYLFTDTRRILLSRLLAATSDQLNDLPQPLFYYISMALCFAGLIAVLAAIIGCWASCSDTYCLLSLYFITVVILLLAESAACLAIILWPQCLGLNLDEMKLVKALQNNYGVPGREQFTVAMDLAQVKFSCCGISNDSDYDKSIWKKNEYRYSDLNVPLSCCNLENFSDRKAHLDPQPLNNTFCQSSNEDEFENFRHEISCLHQLDIWYREQYILFLGGSSVIAIVEFCVLLSIVLSCTKIASRNQRTQRFVELKTRGKSNQTLVENIYEPEAEFPTMARRTMPSTSAELETGRKIFVQPNELYKNRHNTTFKPSSSYQISTRSYLV